MGVGVGELSWEASRVPPIAANLVMLGSRFPAVDDWVDVGLGSGEVRGWALNRVHACERLDSGLRVCVAPWWDAGTVSYCMVRSLT